MKYLLSISFLALVLSGCYYDKEEYLYPDQKACDTVSVTYSVNILPILNGKCLACHGSGSPSSGIDLSTRDKLMPYGTNGHLMGTITWATNFSKMPQGGPSSLIVKSINSAAGFIWECLNKLTIA